MTRTFVSVFVFTILSGVAVFSNAQKLPNKQEKSIWAPADVKIDGALAEWDKLQAFNKSTEIYYTVSNDKNYLYLTIHATRNRVIEKIIEGGVSFTISGKKDDKQKAIVLFPLMPLPICKGTLVSAGKPLTGVTMDENHQDITDQLNNAARSVESASLKKANQALISNLKEIKVSGFDNVVDTIPNVDDKTPYYRTLPLRSHKFKIIKLANNDGINAMMLFDGEGNLNYELAIPLKALNLYINEKGNNFFYNVTVNGRGEDGRPGNTWSYRPKSEGGGILDDDLEEPTDFWGEYTLAKAP